MLRVANFVMTQAKFCALVIDKSTFHRLNIAHMWVALGPRFRENCNCSVLHRMDILVLSKILIFKTLALRFPEGVGEIVDAILVYIFHHNRSARICVPKRCNICLIIHGVSMCRHACYNVFYCAGAILSIVLGVFPNELYVSLSSYTLARR